MPQFHLFFNRSRFCFGIRDEIVTPFLKNIDVHFEEMMNKFTNLAINISQDSPISPLSIVVAAENKLTLRFGTYNIL